MNFGKGLRTKYEKFSKNIYEVLQCLEDQSYDQHRRHSKLQLSTFILTSGSAKHEYGVITKF